MKHFIPILVIAALGTLGCHCRHRSPCDAGRAFDFRPELDETGANSGPALRDELLAIAGNACSVKSDDELLCTRCRDYFGSYVTATHCADRMVPAYCAANCSDVPRPDCLDEPGRSAVRQRCLTESVTGFMKAVPCCGGLEFDMKNERLVLRGSSVAACK
jgi:hypothetical protein